MSGVHPGALIPVGRTLLLAGFGVTLIHAMRGKSDLAVPFERLVVGMVALTYFQSAATQLDALSDQLTDAIMGLASKDDLRTFLLEAFKKAAAARSESGGSTGFNLPAIFEQAWRTGVWGVMSSLVEGTFLIISFVLECAQEVLWKLLLFLFPLAAGAVPICPRMMTNLILYAVELALWFPILCLIELVTGSIARSHVTQAGSWGLYIVGVEVIAIILILMVPMVTHRFLSGAFGGDFNAQNSIFVLARRVMRVGGPAPGGAK